MHDSLKPLLLPRAVARIRNGHDFLDEILKAVDFGRRPAGNSFQDRSNLPDGNVLDVILRISLRIRLVPAVPGCTFVCFLDKLEFALVIVFCLSLKGADGIFRPFLTRVMPLKDERGQVVRWFGTNIDISEQRKTEEMLAAAKKSAGDAKAAAELANRTKDHFLAILSHELRTPLTQSLSYLKFSSRLDLDSVTAILIAQGADRIFLSRLIFHLNQCVLS